MKNRIDGSSVYSWHGTGDLARPDRRLTMQTNAGFLALVSLRPVLG